MTSGVPAAPRGRRGRGEAVPGGAGGGGEADGREAEGGRPQDGGPDPAAPCAAQRPAESGLLHQRRRGAEAQQVRAGAARRLPPTPPPPPAPRPASLRAGGAVWCVPSPGPVALWGAGSACPVRGESGKGWQPPCRPRRGVSAAPGSSRPPRSWPLPRAPLGSASRPSLRPAAGRGAGTG